MWEVRGDRLLSYRSPTAINLHVTPPQREECPADNSKNAGLRSRGPGLVLERGCLAAPQHDLGRPGPRRDPRGEAHRLQGLALPAPHGPGCAAPALSLRKVGLEEWGYVHVKGVSFRYWFTPVGVSLGIKNTRPKMAPHNAVLERAYQQCKKFRHKQVRLDVGVPRGLRVVFVWTGAGARQADGSDGAAGGEVAAAAAGAGQAVGAREVLRELLEVPLLFF